MYIIVFMAHILFHGRYNDLLDSLRFRRAERDRIRSHVAKCSADTNLVGGGVELIQKQQKSEQIMFSGNMYKTVITTGKT